MEGIVDQYTKIEEIVSKDFAGTIRLKKNIDFKLMEDATTS